MVSGQEEHAELFLRCSGIPSRLRLRYGIPGYSKWVRFSYPGTPTSFWATVGVVQGRNLFSNLGRQLLEYRNLKPKIFVWTGRNPKGRYVRPDIDSHGDGGAESSRGIRGEG